MRTLLYEAANVMLTRHKGQLKLKDWAFAIARRSSMRKARIALAVIWLSVPSQLAAFRTCIPYRGYIRYVRGERDGPTLVRYD